MFGLFKTKRDKQNKKPTGENIIDFNQKRREKRYFYFWKSYQLFGKTREFTDWIVWQQRKKRNVPKPPLVSKKGKG